jgi:galactokinase
MRVRLNKKPTPKQQEIVRQACQEEFLKHLRKYNYDAAIQVLHILHFEFGFGQKRLERFADLLNEMQIKQRERYELGEEDTPWLCANQLAEGGIDVSTMLGENYEEKVI